MVRLCVEEKARFQMETERLSVQVSEVIAESQQELLNKLCRANLRIRELERNQAPVFRPATSSRVSPRGRPFWKYSHSTSGPGTQ